jgi:hypothetical protein
MIINRCKNVYRLSLHMICLNATALEFVLLTTEYDVILCLHLLMICFLYIVHTQQVMIYVQHRILYVVKKYVIDVKHHIHVYILNFSSTLSFVERWEKRERNWWVGMREGFCEGARHKRRRREATRGIQTTRSAHRHSSVIWI